MSLWVVFLAGLGIGGLTCLAVQGGLLASVIAAREGEDTDKGLSRRHTLWPIVAFLTAKLVVYTILGSLLGLFGQALSLSANAQIVMQILAGLYMIAVALNLLEVHPIFRYVLIQPPRFLTRLVRNQAKSKDLFAPALLGAMTIFIPCGTTVAMETLAIASGSPILGAVTMLIFILGTVPLFFGVGWLTTVLGDTFKRNFFKIAALAVLYLGIASVNGALVAAGSPITWQTIRDEIPITIDLSGTQASTDAIDPSVRVIGGVQVADISVLPNGYTPNFIKVKAGLPVKLNLNTSGRLGCTSSFRIPSLGISRNLALQGNQSVEFTPPNPGKITWTCSMGMYTGTIQVI